MRHARAEVLVIGGGPAGAATATALALLGRDVILAEASPGPRDRVCGEFLGAGALPLLERLGAVDAVPADAPRLVRARFTAPGRAEATFPLPGAPAASAVGVRRRVLDETLLRRAERAGVRVLRGTRYLAPRFLPSGAVGGADLTTPDGRLEVDASITVGADGRASRVARSLGLDLPRRGHCAVKAHFRRREGMPGPPGGCVEIHMFAGGYVGIAPVDGGRVNVSAVIDARLAASLRGGGLSILLGAASRSDAARERLAGLLPASSPVSLHPLQSARRAVAGDGFLLAGDAARVVPPFTGDGITAALRSGLLAAEASEEALRKGDLSMGGYGARRREILDRPARAASAVERLVHRPMLARPLLGLLRRAPGVAQALVRATRIGAGSASRIIR